MSICRNLKRSPEEQLCEKTPYRRIQEGAKQGHQKKVSRSRGTANHHQRVARESSKIRQKPKAKQSRRKNVGKECSAERSKRDVYCDKQVEKAVTVLNCVLKGLWGEEGSGCIRGKLKSRSTAYL